MRNFEEYKKKQLELEEILKKQTDQMKKILSEHEMKIEITGCGCCGSPSVKFEYRGEPIVFDDNNDDGCRYDAIVDMFECESSESEE